jgi:hypothetical protein
VPDLPLLDNSFKVGFGLWRYLWLSFPLEIALIVAGAWIYARAVRSRTPSGDLYLWLFVAAMALVETYGTFGPEPTSPIAAAQTALVAYFILAALAGAVDWARGTAGSLAAKSRAG